MTFPPPTATSEKLIAANLGLAHKAAWSWHRRTGQPYDDLEAIAYMGLIRGCRKYDPERLNPATGRPYAISTIVCPFVTGEILHWFRDRGYAVRFPSKWREKWGLVQRLMADPAVSFAEVIERSGMDAEEIAEMLASMKGTANLDELHGADACEDAEIEVERLGPLQRLIRQAWANMHPADQGLLVNWWGNQRRNAYPSGPMQQFHWRLKALLGGRNLREYEQAALLTVTTSGPTRREYERQALQELFGVDEPVRVAKVRREADGAVQLAMV